MITVRNPSAALSVSARTAAATAFVPGMIVKFAQGTASGDQPTVVAPLAADMSDAKVLKGIVDFVTADSQDVDFTINPATQALTLLSEVIPAGSQVNVWMGKIVIAYNNANLPAALQGGTVREATTVTFSNATQLPAVYNAAGTDGSQVVVGMVYRVDGPEVTMIITL